MTLQDLKNLRAFMDRITLTGAEAIAWVQAVNALQVEIATRELPTPPATPKAPKASTK